MRDEIARIADPTGALVTLNSIVDNPVWDHKGALGESIEAYDALTIQWRLTGHVRYLINLQDNEPL